MEERRKLKAKKMEVSRERERRRWLEGGEWTERRYNERLVKRRERERRPQSTQLRGGGGGEDGATKARERGKNSVREVKKQQENM